MDDICLMTFSRSRRGVYFVWRGGPMFHFHFLTLHVLSDLLLIYIIQAS